MHGEACSTGSVSHETDSGRVKETVESKKSQSTQYEDWYLSRDSTTPGLVVPTSAYNGYSTTSSTKLAPTPSISIYTDASPEGWGAHMGQFTVQGLWSKQDHEMHSNIKELKAVLLAAKALFPRFPDHKVIQVVSENTTVVWYINKQGGQDVLSW